MARKKEKQERMKRKGCKTLYKGDPKTGGMDQESDRSVWGESESSTYPKTGCEKCSQKRGLPIANNRWDKPGGTAAWEMQG